MYYHGRGRGSGVIPSPLGFRIKAVFKSVHAVSLVAGEAITSPSRVVSEPCRSPALLPTLAGKGTKSEAGYSSTITGSGPTGTSAQADCAGRSSLLRGR